MAARKSTTKTRKAGGDSTTRADVYEIITEKIVAMLEAGTVPWHKPWSTAGGMPMSLSSHKPYRGINVFLLGIASLAAGYSSPWWGTYDKISESGGQVRKGETSTMVTFWGRYNRWVTDDATGKREQVPAFVLRYYRVFNSEQADWQPGKGPIVCTAPLTEVQRLAAGEAVIAGYSNPPAMLTGGAAYYRPSTDELTMPPLNAFDAAEGYYSTLFHELTHSTGARSRLDRPGFAAGAEHTFGTPGYSKEELVAEMGAAMLCAVAGLDVTVTLPNSAAYVANWLTALANDRKLVVQAAAQAQKAVDHILGTTYAEAGEPAVERELIPA
jgi:antirestriction protein ArdC